ncbi:MAG: DUF6010 family protein [Bacteroidota bacterium]
MILLLDIAVTPVQISTPIGIGLVYIAYHLHGNLIIPFEPNSSFGRAICDPVLAIWFFMGVPSVFYLFSKKKLKTA